MSCWPKGTLFRLWLLMLPAFLGLWYFPSIDFLVRILTWAVGFLILAGAFYFSSKLRVLRWFLAALYVGVVVFLLLPLHRPVDRPALQADYCAALTAYTGCRYVWGGEGYMGIDCSGLVRKGMEDALATRGCFALDPALVRESISLYWHDTTAQAMGQGYAGRMRVVTECPSLNQLDYAKVRSGDLAVTAGGDHVLAYLGDKTWIAADPIAGRVTSFVIPEQKNPYFSMPMRIVRWQVLE
jgi:NlpC/P60 family